jgi:hypothetical protein
MANFIIVSHNDPNITTIGGYISRQQVPILSITDTFTVEDFLNFQDGNNESNINKILIQWGADPSASNTTSRRRTQNQQRYDNGDFTEVELRVGTQLAIPVSSISREVLFRSDTNVINTTESRSYIANQLDQLLRDPNYTTVLKNTSGRNLVLTHNVRPTAYLWSKALSSPNGQDNTGGWFDLSPFIQGMNTSVSKEGGSFNISLPGVQAVFNPITGWGIDPRSTENYKGNLGDNNILVKSSIHTGNGIDRNNFFFNTIIAENDLIYIRFERIVADESIDNGEEGQEISSNSIPGKTYDMIGLVDTSTISYSAESNDISINVAGRDLMKVFIEDGSYFFPSQFSANGIFANSVLLRDRVFFGNLPLQSLRGNRSILFTLQFIINKLSNAGWVNDSAFSGYSIDTLSKRFEITQDVKSRLIDNDDPDLIDVDIEVIEKATQNALPGVWSIIKLMVDPSVTDRRIVDSSISVEQGSIINSINKICQDPFVEFYGDTYKDQYVFTARKPPFDREAYTSLVYGSNESISSGSHDINEVEEFRANTSLNILPGITIESGSETPISPTLIDIKEGEVISDSLNFSTEAYSWYFLRPQGLLFGTTAKTTLEYLPAIALDEYAEIFGARSYDKTTTYISLQPHRDNNEDAREINVTAQAIQDLKYMIDSSAYLPFTRQGTIVLNGKRTIKRGIFVRYFPTNEIFYVDNVVNDFQINSGGVDRTTTLTVSRGMVESLIRPRDIDGIVGVSYFNIVDTTVPEQYTAADTRDFLRNWRVNPDIFNFFLRRRQFDQSLSPLRNTVDES